MAREGLFDDCGWHGCDNWWHDECKKCIHLKHTIDWDRQEEYYTCKCYPDCEEELEEDC